MKGHKKHARYTDKQKLDIVEKAAKLNAKGFDMTEVAQKLEIPRSSLYSIISSDTLWTRYKKRKKQVLDAEFARTAQEALAAARKKRSKAKYKDLVVSAAIAHDKIFPAPTNLTQIKATNVSYSVGYPKMKTPKTKKKGKDKG